MNDTQEPYVGMPIYLEDYEEESFMEARPEASDCMYGQPFESWPLAMAYVPFQPWEETYEPERAMQAGTIFPSLDLPFFGRDAAMNDRTEMMHRVQQLNFVMIDVGLFLNNQPDDRRALELFGKYQALYAKAKREFEDLFGPLTYDGIRTADGWTWLREPWPWEVED